MGDEKILTHGRERRGWLRKTEERVTGFSVRITTADNGEKDIATTKESG